MPITNCAQCRGEFYAKPYHLRKGQGRFCSIKCKGRASEISIQFDCAVCKKKIERLPSRVSRSKSGKFFCTKSCQTIWRNQEFSGVRHKGWKDGSSRYREILLRSNRVQKCAGCHVTDVRILAVHHVDQNRKNNVLGNLRWLCHNCHYLAHHDSLGMSSRKH